LDKTKFLSIIKIVWLLAVILGGIFYFVRNYAIVIDYIHTIDVQKLLISFLLIIGMRILQTLLVQRSLVLADWNLDFEQVFSLVSISQLGKYIPGGVWQFVARFTAYRENQLSYKNIGKAFLIENVWLVFGSFFVGVYLVFLGKPAFLLKLFGFYQLTNIHIIIASLSLLLWIIVLFAIEYGVKSETRKPSSLVALKQFISQTSMWFLLGASFSCLFNNIGNLNDFLFITGVFVLSFLAGYIVVFAPGGIGVREYIAVMLLSFMFSSTEIGFFAIVHRLLYTLAEFLLAGISLILNRKNKTRGNELRLKAAQEEQLNEV
jgi:uncharacterized membrane protein YbhN (UPF0104 family)